MNHISVITKLHLQSHTKFDFFKIADLSKEKFFWHFMLFLMPGENGISSHTLNASRS